MDADEVVWRFVVAAGFTGDIPVVERTVDAGVVAGWDPAAVRPAGAGADEFTSVASSPEGLQLVNRTAGIKSVDNTKDLIDFPRILNKCLRCRRSPDLHPASKLDVLQQSNR